MYSYFRVSQAYLLNIVAFSIVVQFSTLTHIVQHIRETLLIFCAIMVRRSIHREWYFWKAYPWAKCLKPLFAYTPWHGCHRFFFYIRRATSSMQCMQIWFPFYVNCFVLYCIFCAILILRWTAT
jgi:hypothetical protein